jgi:hypothetical protein
MKDEQGKTLITDTPNKFIDFVSKVKDNLRLPYNDRNE